MDQNEYKFAKNIVNHDKQISEAIDYVIRNFGVKAEYDEENNIINLTTANINEGLQLLAAKEYIDNNFDKDFIHTNLDD
jgi:hypothetical protein